MVEVLHSATVAQASKQVESRETLVGSDNDLLERYLHLLDHYQTLQQSLAQLLSRVRLHLPEYHLGLILNLHRVIYLLLKPTFRVRIVFATARSFTMIECKHQLVCAAPVY